MALKGSCLNLLLVLVFAKVIVAFKDELVRINRPVQSDLERTKLATDGVRCFCNLPVCVSTGYMCKSEGGGCFSDLMAAPSRMSAKSSAAMDGRRGCLELLNERQHRRQCQNMPGGEAPSKEHPRSLLLCCFTDMCNHVDNQDTKIRINDSLIATVSMTNELDNGAPTHENSYNSEIWFRIATIAVPIFGAIILFLLIGIAMKILRTDTLDHSIKLSDPYSRSDRHSRDHFNHIHHSMHKKEPLLIHHNLESSSRVSCTNHSADELLKATSVVVPLLVQNQTQTSTTGVNYDNRKNETNAKLNSAYGHEYNLLLQQQNCDNHRDYSMIQHADRLITNNLHKTSGSNVNNIYRNVNLTNLEGASDFSCSKAGLDDKLYDKQGLQGVVVTWPDNSNL